MARHDTGLQDGLGRRLTSKHARMQRARLEVSAFSRVRSVRARACVTWRRRMGQELLIDKIIPVGGGKRVQKVGNGLMGKRGTYRERRCGIADSCGPYLDVCASQRVRNNEKERTIGVTVQHCHRVRRGGWRGASCFWERPELLR